MTTRSDKCLDRAHNPRLPGAVPGSAMTRSEWVASLLRNCERGYVRFITGTPQANT